MSQNLVVQALEQLLAAYGPDAKSNQEAKALVAALTKQKALKDALSPLAKLFKYGARIERILQICVELPPSHPLHEAARVVLSRPDCPYRPYVAVPAAGQPKRWSTQLVPGRHEPVVYVVEDRPVIALWSVETGAHLLDLKVPAAKGSTVRALVELADGRLRVISSCGVVSERSPGGKSLVKRHEIGATKPGWAASPDLRFHVRQPAFQPEDGPDGPVQQLVVHDLEAGTTRAFRFPGSYLCDRFFRATPTTVVIGGYRNVEVTPDEWHAMPFVLVVDLAAQTLVQHALAHPDHQVWMLFPAQRQGHVKVQLTPMVGHEWRWLELDLASGATAPAEPEPDATPASGVRCAGGQLTYHLYRHTFVDEAGRVVGGYQLPGEPHNTLAAYDALRDRLIVAGSDPATPVFVLVPYDPAAAAAQAAPAPELRPLSWAQPGAVLRYALADFDAADEWTFTVVAVGDELVLAVAMEDERVSEGARFTAAALDGAARFVELAQGGADVDLAAPIEGRVPPILLSRAMMKKLAGKKKLSYVSAWSKKVTLEPGSPGVGSVRQNGMEERVATLSAASEDGATLVVLDDPRWPLVLERLEGDCYIRLIEITLPRS